MIFRDNVNDIESNLESKSFGVNIEDVGFIINAITNLYSDPISSIVRELASNCRDADPDKMFIVGMDERTIFFRDFGTGMSEEFMLNGYLSIGSSTKRQNSKAIGSYGFGRLSVLAYTENYFITTCYEGVKSKYIVAKDGATPSISLLEQIPTEDTGTIIMFPYEKNHRDVWHLVIQNHTEYFNNCEIQLLSGSYRTEIQKFEHNGLVMLKSKFNIRPHLVVGECFYPIDPKQIEINHFGFSECNFGIYIPIEEGFRPTPSREGMVYTNDFKDYLREKLIVFDEYLEKVCFSEVHQPTLMKMYNARQHMVDIRWNIKYELNSEQLIELRKLIKIDWTTNFYRSYFYNQMFPKFNHSDLVVVCPEIIPRGFMGFCKGLTHKYQFVKKDYSSIIDPKDKYNKEEIKRRREILEVYFAEMLEDPRYFTWEEFVEAEYTPNEKEVKDRVVKKGYPYWRSPWTSTSESLYIADKIDISDEDLLKYRHYIALGKPNSISFSIFTLFQQGCQKPSIWLNPRRDQMSNILKFNKIIKMEEVLEKKNPMLTKVYHDILIDQAVSESGIRLSQSYTVNDFLRLLEGDLFQYYNRAPLEIKQEVRSAIIEAAESLGIDPPECLAELKKRKNVFKILACFMSSHRVHVTIEDLQEELTAFVKYSIGQNDKAIRLARFAQSPFTELTFEFELDEVQN